MLLELTVMSGVLHRRLRDKDMVGQRFNADGVIGGTAQSLAVKNYM
jgi:hypothetical protein